MQTVQDTELPLIEDLLRYELHAFAAQLGWSSQHVQPLGDEQAVQVANAAERLSRRAATDLERQRCLAICALLWEHRRSEWKAMPAFLVHVLNRIELGPSAAMIGMRDGRLFSTGSLRAEMEAASQIAEHEVSILGHTTLLLSGFQRRLWTALADHSKLGVSAPTSAGKSFVLVHRLVDLLSTGGIAVFVVPTISLIQQVSADIRTVAAKSGIPLTVLQTVPVEKEQDIGFATAYVLTQERALAALNAQAWQLRNPRIVVVDEIQNIERVSDDDSERSQALRDVVRIFNEERDVQQFVVSGARIVNVTDLARRLLGVAAEGVSDDVPPVVNLTYAIGETEGLNVVRLHSQLTPQRLEHVIDTFPDLKVSGSTYPAPMLDLLAGMTESLRGQGTLIFSPTSNQARVTAAQLKARAKSFVAADDAEQLSEYLAETVHRDYPLVETVRSGIGYHHGKMPQHARLCIEQAFLSKVLPVVVCTTTLMQGVNLPAKTIITRNPNLFVRRRADGTSPTLTGYEFTNLRGRAGRLMHDFVGRTVVLDEGAYEEADIDLSVQSERDVVTTYSERFEERRREILDDLREEKPLEEGGSELVVYIRRMAFHYGKGAAEKLSAVGIRLSARDLNRVVGQMGRLTVPRQIAAHFPYWDPVALSTIFEANGRGKFPHLPQSPFAKDFVERIREALDKLREVVPFYYDKYFGADTTREVTGILVSARQWAQEIPLQEILSRRDREPLAAKEIDHRIEVVTKRVSFDLPKILRPLSLIQAPGSGLLSCLETGAFHEATKTLMGLGLPREAACRVRNAGVRDTNDPREAILQVRAVLMNLKLWDRIQVTAVLPMLDPSKNVTSGVL